MCRSVILASSFKGDILFPSVMHFLYLLNGFSSLVSTVKLLSKEREKIMQTQYLDYLYNFRGTPLIYDLPFYVLGLIITSTLSLKHHLGVTRCQATDGSCKYQQHELLLSNKVRQALKMDVQLSAVTYYVSVFKQSTDRISYENNARVFDYQK